MLSQSGILVLTISNFRGRSYSLLASAKFRRRPRQKRATLRYDTSIVAERNSVADKPKANGSFSSAGFQKLRETQDHVLLVDVSVANPQGMALAPERFKAE